MELKDPDNEFQYTFKIFSDLDEITHGVFTGFRNLPDRKTIPFNTSHSDDYSSDSVEHNRLEIKNVLDVNQLFFLNQVHGTQVVTYPGSREGDASVTDKKGIGLVIQTADCQPVMLYDPEKKIIANIHSGWKGSVSNIIGETIHQMKKMFNCHPGDILAGIGPSLGPCCSEFINYRQEIPEKYWNYKRENRLFDFWQLSRDQLQNEGVSAIHIENMEICTKCHSDVFYSYRKNKTKGRFSSVIGMRNRTW